MAVLSSLLSKSDKSLSLSILINTSIPQQRRQSFRPLPISGLGLPLTFGPFGQNENFCA